MNRSTLTEDERDELSIVGLVTPLWGHRRLLVLTTIIMTALAIALSIIHYFWWQPARWTAALEFRPAFLGAAAGTYPNGLAFAPSDIIDASVLDQVFDANKIQDFCSRNDFRSAFFIEQRSSELELIDSEYQARLADARLSVIDRQRLMDEYQARRASAPVQFAVSFIRPGACATISATMARKVLDDVLLTWATDSETKRGVLKQRVRVLTPNMLDISAAARQSLFVRANMVWTNIDRIVRNMGEVEVLPGAELVRLSDSGISLAEVKAKMEDLQHAQLEALMTSIGASRDRADSLRWVDEALATAINQQQVAQNRAKANLDALREYSGTVPQPNTMRGEAERPEGAADVQGLMPQIDRTFIDRILEMAAPNTAFRQELTRAMVNASLEAVESESIVNHYRQLQSALKNNGSIGSNSAPEDFDAKLAEIVSTGKELIRQFNGLYEQWSLASFRSGSSIYQTEGPVSITMIRAFGIRAYAVAVGLVFFLTLIFAVLAALVHTHVWPAIAANKSPSVRSNVGE